MYISRLSLQNFRNYNQAEATPTSGVNLILGSNAQGKSNLLEAIVCLSTTKSFRTSNDWRLVNQASLDEPIPFARLRAELEDAPVRTVELIIVVERENATLRSRKRLRLDGVNRRLMEALGCMPTVLFTPEDIELVSGSPAIRRRFLDVLLCQADRDYCRALAIYNRALTQRNHLLRLIQTRNSDPEQLHYWDQILAEQAAIIIRSRQEAIVHMVSEAGRVHSELSHGEELALIYRTNTEVTAGELGAADAAALLLQQYATTHSQDIKRGLTSVGPHRDDVLISLDRAEASGFASRGQMRTIALTLRLAQATYLRQTLGHPPLLLFDDVMSELDRRRRTALERAMLDSSQTFVTALDVTPFSPRFLQAARVYHVSGGHIAAVNQLQEGDDWERPPCEDIAEE